MWFLQPATLPLPARLAIAGIAFCLGVPICSRAAEYLERKDPPEVVLDEIAAFPIVFLTVPVDLTTGVLGFLWFRLFDITKPWPMKRLEHLPRGLGIMADDSAAALYAACIRF